MAPFRTAAGIRVAHDPNEADTSAVIGAACAQALQVIDASWGLPAPADCRVVVMTTWWGFVFESAPWSWRLLLVALPLWALRARRTWPISAAWTLRYGRRVVIGIKPPRLWAQSDPTFSLGIFVEESDTPTQVRHLVCHELTHACSAHLKLPAWLNEGLAAVTVDRFLGKQTIRSDSRALVRDYQPKARPPGYRELSRLPGPAMAYHVVRGYWLVRYLEEVHPGFLRQCLAAPQPAHQLEAEVARVAGVEPGQLWVMIDDLIAAYRWRASGDLRG